MREDGHVRKHFVINEFVLLGGLDNPIECHHAAEFFVVEDDQVLVLGFIFEQHLIDGEELSPVRIKRFSKLAHISLPVRRCFVPLPRQDHRVMAFCGAG